MSVEMWNCHFWPLSASYIYMHCSRCSNETDLLLERPGGYIIRCTWCHTDILLYLPISWGVTLTFLYIFLLLDCFTFALIDCIEKQRAHSELWQFQLGEVYCKMYLVSHWHFIISPYSLRVSHWHFLISSYYLTVSNLLSLTALKSEEFTLSSGSFKWGGYIVRCTWCHTDISLYLPITWLFRICSHWPHWKVKSSLWALAVSNGGSIW